MIHELAHARLAEIGTGSFFIFLRGGGGEILIFHPALILWLFNRVSFFLQQQLWHHFFIYLSSFTVS